MADPLSVAAGIAGLVTLGLQITDGFTHYYHAFRDRDENIRRTLVKLETLACCLAALRKTVTTTNLSVEETEVARAIQTSVQNCDALLNKLSTKLMSFREATSTLDTKDQPRRKRAKLIYPFQAGTLLRLEAEILDAQEHLSFALNVLQMRTHNQDRFVSASTKRLLENVQGGLTSALLKSWLNPPNATADQNATFGNHFVQPGIWFISGAHFTNWLNAENSFLWIHGFLGSGKSVLCSTAVQHALKYKQKTLYTGVAFYYFDASEVTKQRVSELLRSLIWQLSHQNTSAYERLKNLHNQYQDATPSIEALLNCLKHIILCFQQVYVLLDALDECPREQARTQVLDTLNLMRKWNLPAFHLLVTSRDEVEIWQGLEASSSQHVVMRDPGVDAEICAYISSRLQVDRRLVRWQSHTALIKDTLLRQACGMFRWVECQLNALQYCPVSKSHLEICLATPVPALENTYERMLCQIDESWYEDARRILMLLCFARRPLRPTELIDALAVSLTHPPRLDLDRRLSSIDDILELCPGLIEATSTNKTSPEAATSSLSCEIFVQLVHWSVKEYLESDRVRQRSARFFAMEINEANQEIARICLVYLHCLNASSTALGVAVPAASCFAHYAGPLWHEHYKFIHGTSASTDDLVLDLLTESGLYNQWQRCSSPSSGYDYRRPRPLYWAIALGLDTVIEKILAKEDSPVQTEPDLSHPLHHESTTPPATSSQGDVQLKRMLIEFGAHTDGQMLESSTTGLPISKSCEKSYADTIRLLIRTGAVVDTRKKSNDLVWLFGQIEEHLMIAHMLIDSGTDQNIVDEYTRSRAIYLAVKTGNADILPLLHAGKTENVPRTVQPQNAAYVLRSSKNERPVLCGPTDDPDNRWRETALSEASGRGQFRIVDFLLEFGADIDTNGTGLALYEASLNGRLEIVHFLLSEGAKVNIGRDSELIAAAKSGHTEIVQSLVNAGANVNRRTLYGETALSVAAKAGYVEVVKILIEAGVDVDAGRGLALRYASKKIHNDIVKALLDAGAIPTPWQERDHCRYGELSRSKVHKTTRIRRPKAV